MGQELPAPAHAAAAPRDDHGQGSVPSERCARAHGGHPAGDPQRRLRAARRCQRRRDGPLPSARSP
jgi:hypothetical protein